jgi:hypothetical protein
MTHYVLALARYEIQLGQPHYETACGDFVRLRHHSTEPTCPACLKYLNADPTPETGESRQAVQS